MEGTKYLEWDNKTLNWVEEEEDKLASSIIQPQTPKEPLDFLSRSWSLSANQISKALAQKPYRPPTQFVHDLLLPESITVPVPDLSNKGMNVPRRSSPLGKWFHHKELSSSMIKKKDKARIENARTHTALSVAGLSAALAAVASAQNTNGSTSKMTLALASATQLLASHCIELAESAGTHHDRVASVVRSAVDIRSPSDLVTLTAAAATALRGEAALKARLPKEAKKNAAISPYDKGMAAFHSEHEEHDPPCIGDLLQYTRKGVLRWKHVTIYINKKSQVIIKLKSKHVGGAFSKKNKCIVYGVCNEASAWPFRKERENVETYFGLKSGKGLIEFKCKNKIHKQNWVDGIQNLLQRTNTCIEEADSSLRMLNINKSI